MYITRIELENLKSFEKFTWQLSPDENPAGWHVLLGDNGSGKSTFIKSAALALLSKDEAYKVRQDLSAWVRQNQEAAFIRLTILPHEELDLWSRKGRTHVGEVSYTVKISDQGKLSQHGTPSPMRHVWGNKGGWFSASYGPFRRFSGGNRENEKLFYSAPLLARHLTVFGEDVALTETLEWLGQLRFRELEDATSQEAHLLHNICAFINQKGFLPNGVSIEQISSSGVLFVDGSGMQVDINALSDGYRSILSLILELIRQMSKCYGMTNIFNAEQTSIKCPGVVFIDEVDVHLHLKWQRQIGLWLTEHFPKVQFIVSSHSPFVCQSATTGSVWRLPQPGDEYDNGERIEGVKLQRLLYGDILEALSSGVFGFDVNRSESAQSMMQELAELNVKAMFESLSDADSSRREELQRIFNTESNTQNVQVA